MKEVLSETPKHCNCDYISRWYFHVFPCISSGVSHQSLPRSPGDSPTGGFRGASKRGQRRSRKIWRKPKRTRNTRKPSNSWRNRGRNWESTRFSSLLTAALRFQESWLDYGVLLIIIVLLQIPLIFWGIYLSIYDVSRFFVLKNISHQTFFHGTLASPAFFEMLLKLESTRSFYLIFCVLCKTNNDIGLEAEVQLKTHSMMNGWNRPTQYT